MRNGNLLLSVLGTFYSQVGRSPLVNGLNDIYSRIIMERYIDTISKKVALGTGDIPDVSHYGHIPWSGYSPKGEITSILSPSGQEIDIDEVDYISFPYIREGLFFRIKNGKISKECVAELSKIDSDMYPVIYTINATKKMFSNGLFDYQENLSSDDDTIITREAIGIVTNLSIYGADSFNTLDIVANILCGATYVTGTGTVLFISETEIGTTLGTFSISGTVAVSVGQELSGITLLTRQIIISREGSILPDVRKINERMRMYSSSPSRISYLKKISRAISKRKYTILIPVDVFSSLEKSGLAVLSSILNTSISSSFDSRTNISQEDDVRLSTDGHMSIMEETVARVSIIEAIMVNIEQGSHISLRADERLNLRQEEGLNTESSLDIKMTPLIIEDLITGIDKRMRVVQLQENPHLREDYFIEGTKQEHTIVRTDKEDSLVIEGNSSMSVVDGGGIYKEGTSLLYDTVKARDSDKSTITAYEISDMLLREKQSFILGQRESMGILDALEIKTTRKFFSTGTNDSLMKTASESHSLMSTTDINVVTLSESHRGIPSETSESRGVNSMDYTSVSTEGVEALIVKIKDITLGVDESSVESSNEIDER